MSCAKEFRNPITGCNQDPGLIKQLLFVKKAFSFSTYALANALANWEAGIYNKNVFVLPLLANAEASDTEAQYDDTPWRKMKTRDGIMGLKVYYDSGLDLNVRLQSFDSSGELSCFLCYETGLIVGYNPIGTTVVKGLETSFINPENYKQNFGSPNGQTPLLISFKDARQFNQWPAVLVPASDVAPWDYTQLEALKDVTIEVLSATATKIVVRAYLTHIANQSGQKIDVLGLTKPDFSLAKTDGTAQTIATITNVTTPLGVPTMEINGTGLVSGFIGLVPAASMVLKSYEGYGTTIVTIP